MKRHLLEPNNRLCGGCSSSERWLLHYVRLRGTFQRLCTNCVLKSHPGLFCPICLNVFDLDTNPNPNPSPSPSPSPNPSPPPPPSRDRVMCVKCPSVAHSDCAASPSFECPPCSSSSSSFSFFSVDRASADGGDGAELCTEHAKAFVAAAKIAVNSMKKAAAAARADAERRVREAVSAKKRAREALEVLAYIVTKDKQEKKKELNSEQQKPKSETAAAAGAMQVLPNGNQVKQG